MTTQRHLILALLTALVCLSPTQTNKDPQADSPSVATGYVARESIKVANLTSSTQAFGGFPNYDASLQLIK